MIRSEKLFNGVPPSSTIIQIKDPQKAFIKKWIHAATGATFHGKRKPRRSGANFLAFYRSIPTKRRLSFDGVM
jgi:hypothetical protein